MITLRTLVILSIVCGAIGGVLALALIAVFHKLGEAVRFWWLGRKFTKALKDPAVWKDFVGIVFLQIPLPEPAGSPSHHVGGLEWVPTAALLLGLICALVSRSRSKP
jgi:hypothetical protein